METTSISHAAQIIVAIIPIVGIAIGGVIVFFYLLWHHHEVKLQVKNGTYKKGNFDLKSFSLLTGMLLTSVGSMLTIIFAILAGLSYALLGGLIPLALGISFIVFYKINPDFHQNEKK